MRVLTKPGAFPAKYFSINVMPNVTHVRGVGHPYLHRHTFHELVLITCGSAIHITGRERLPLVPGDLLAIHPPRSHRYIPLHDFELTNILFEPGELAHLPPDIRALPGFRRLLEPELDGKRRSPFRNVARMDDADFRRAKTLALQLNATILARQAGFESRARRQFIRLIRHVAMTCRPRPVLKAGPDSRLGPVMALLESNPSRRVRLVELAAMARMSRSTFQRAFRTAYGGSPIDHLIRLRLARAEHLLRTTGLSITEVGFRAGFEDSNYFIRLFRKARGLTPRQYRHAAVGH